MITRKQLEKTISARRKLITEKVRKAFYIEEELLEQVDDLLEQADVRSRNEFVNQALKFYIGYLTSEKIENYMLTTISSVMHATVKDSENRMARAMYKLAVETSKLSHVIAYSHGVDEQTLSKLQAKCAEEVKRINGVVQFEDSYKYQNV
ncbi:hypothetical protein [Simiaoa sp.]|uniref:hypothetical protein n=1 Tax=Simiaoa sp. TaxID=2944202 RepID=UPI003F801018